MTLLISALLSCTPPPLPAPPERSNLLIVALDNVRYDHTSLGGYEKPTSPNLQALADSPGAIRFERAYASASFSLPSYTSLFTGLAAARHQVGFVDQRLDDQHATTLAEVAAAYGYQTAAFTGGVHLSRGTGLAQGFSTWKDTGWDLGPIGPQVTRALSWLADDRDPDTPFFLFVHGYDAHAPYPSPEGRCADFDPGYDGQLHDLPDLFTVRGIQGIAGDTWWGALKGEALPALPTGWAAGGALQAPPTIFQGREPYQRPRGGPVAALTEADLAHLRAHYDASIAQADAGLGRLLAGLEDAGLAESTLVVALSDHGEMLGEYGYFRHDVDADEAAFRVPMVLRLPGASGPTRAHAPVTSLLDLSPTLLEALGMTPPADIDGRSQLAAWRAAPRAEPLPLSGLLGPEPPDRSLAPIAAMASTCCYAVRTEGWYLLRQNMPLDQPWKLFADAKGPDVADDEPEVVRALTAAVDGWPADLYDVPDLGPAPDRALREKLRDAGYWTPPGDAVH